MAAFQLNAGHPVLDLVNTLDNRFVEKGPTELLGHYADLLRFAEESKLIDAVQRQSLSARQDSRAARDALRSVRELREALADVFYRSDGAAGERAAAAITTLERHFSAASAQRHLIIANTPDAEVPRFTLAWVASADRCELPVWILAERTRELLLSDDMQFVHRCQSDACQWLFLDTSKNHSRRWCDMKVCGNRMKARRFRSRGISEP